MSTTAIGRSHGSAERALLRIERAVERGAMDDGKGQALRAKVADALAELDVIIREASHG